MINRITDARWRKMDKYRDECLAFGRSWEAQRPEGGGTDKKDDGAKWRNELEATKAA
jgi:hypothetical protein